MATYSYTNDQNRYLERLDYGNGDKVQYTYDDQGRVIKETFESGQTVSYAYDNTGALATVTDSETGRKTTYYYDLADRMMKYVESGSGYSHSVGYEYDTLNNLTMLVETINGEKHTTSYTYDTDNRVTSVTNGDSDRTYSYNGFGQISGYVTTHNDETVLTETIAYKNGEAATGQVDSHKFSFMYREITYLYEYDGNGNIVSLAESSVTPRALGPTVFTTTYVYDNTNQLIRENNELANKIWVWTYDNAGNILSRTEYEYTRGSLGEALDTVVYTYGNSEWGDLLTAYDGNAITYDGIGNPLTDGTWTYTWKHGRELATMSDGTSTWTYTYDANGMRTKRTNGTTTYTYVYNGGQLTQMTVGTDVLTFTYDANGNPFTFTYNGDLYYYVTNVQGDVVMLINSAGIALASYSYDAWGNLITIDASGDSALSIATINPLRYRGYVYDNQTELYYLQSRYYNPEIGRFLSADAVFDYDAGLQGFNLFAYCGNDPINRVDISGADSVSMDDATEDILEAKTLEGGSSAMGRSFSNAYNPMDAGYSYRVDLSQAVRSSSFSGGISSNGYSASEYTGGEKTEIHHIVEQCQQKKSGFSSADIQAESNKIALPYSVHRKISGYYSSIQPGTSGLRVRDWLAGQSFAEQTTFGWGVIDRYMRE